MIGGVLESSSTVPNSGAEELPRANEAELVIRQSVILAAAKLLAESPFAAVSLDQVSRSSHVALGTIREHFPSMHDLACSILDAEGDAMRGAQHRASNEVMNPLDRLRSAFRIVGENMSTNVVVRAGMRLASESHQYFPERNIDPYRTWQKYISSELSDAHSRGMLVDGVDIQSVTWMLVAAGMGTKELVAFRKVWHEVSPRLEATLGTVLDIISREPDDTLLRG